MQGPDFMAHPLYIHMYIDGSCYTQGRDEKCIQNFGRKTWRDQLGVLGVDVSITLEWSLKKENNMAWIQFGSEYGTTEGGVLI
jgi:hypothetical protein